MHYSIAFIAALTATVQAHGVITEIQGANGVTMPGLSGKHLPQHHQLNLLTIFLSPGWHSP
jgi:hypothetical protein